MVFVRSGVMVGRLEKLEVTLALIWKVVEKYLFESDQLY
jgi:hypothetical protein